MKITERRLRQLIRQVIKESRINEMESPFGMDSYMGAAGHAQSTSEMLSETFIDFKQLMDPAEALHMGVTGSGLLTMLASGNENILDTQFLVGLGICVGAALWIVIRNYLESGNIMYANKNEAIRLQKMQESIEKECPKCIEDVSRVEREEY